MCLHFKKYAVILKDQLINSGRQTLDYTFLYFCLTKCKILLKEKL